MKFEKKYCNLCKRGDTTVLYKIGDYHIVKCKKCNLVYVQEIMNEKNSDDLYSEEYFYYKNYKNLQTEIRQMMKISLFVNLDRYRLQNTLLEVGCAEGIFLEAAKRKGWQVSGVEISQWASKFAREELNLQVFTGSLEQTCFSENYFDVIYMNHVIEHLDNPIKVLRILLKILRPGGIAIINTPNFNGLSRIVLKEEWRAISPERHLYYFTPHTLRKLLIKTGFKIDKIVTHGLEPYPIMEKGLQKIRLSTKKTKLNVVREANKRFNENALQSKFFPFFKMLINNVLKIIPIGDTVSIVAKKENIPFNEKQ